VAIVGGTGFIGRRIEGRLLASGHAVVAAGGLSMGVYPARESYALLAELGMTGAPATLALYGGATPDLVLGALLSWRRRPALIGAAQLASMAAFTLLAAGLPGECWLHPFAPILKNPPIAAAILVMMALETD
jgi:hypothetical protein